MFRKGVQRDSAQRQARLVKEWRVRMGGYWPVALEPPASSSQLAASQGGHKVAVRCSGNQPEKGQT